MDGNTSLTTKNDTKTAAEGEKEAIEIAYAILIFAICLTIFVVVSVYCMFRWIERHPRRPNTNLNYVHIPTNTARQPPPKPKPTPSPQPKVSGTRGEGSKGVDVVKGDSKMESVAHPKVSSSGESTPVLIQTKAEICQEIPSCSKKEQATTEGTKQSHQRRSLQLSLDEAKRKIEDQNIIEVVPSPSTLSDVSWSLLDEKKSSEETSSKIERPKSAPTDNLIGLFKKQMSFHIDRLTKKKGAHSSLSLLRSFESQASGSGQKHTEIPLCVRESKKEEHEVSEPSTKPLEEESKPSFPATEKRDDNSDNRRSVISVMPDQHAQASSRVIDSSSEAPRQDGSKPEYSIYTPELQRHSLSGVEENQYLSGFSELSTNYMEEETFGSGLDLSIVTLKQDSDNLRSRSAETQRAIANVDEQRSSVQTEESTKEATKAHQEEDVLSDLDVEVSKQTDKPTSQENDSPDLSSPTQKQNDDKIESTPSTAGESETIQQEDSENVVEEKSPKKDISPKTHKQPEKPT